MDWRLVEGAISAHGSDLARKLMTDLHDTRESRKIEKIQKVLETQDSSYRCSQLEKNFADKLFGFISKKADLLYATPENVTFAGVTTEEEEPNSYALMPTLEQFMGVPYSYSKERFFSLIKPGDIVAGQIVGVKDFGLLVRLLCLCDSDKARHIDCLDLVALCPTIEVPKTSTYGNPLEHFNLNEPFRAKVIKVIHDEEKIILSLFKDTDSMKLGVITEVELPSHYKRGLFLDEKDKTYDEMLHHIVGFSNPQAVSYLRDKLGLDDRTPPSLFRKLHSGKFASSDYAKNLRKEQTSNWSLESVKKGVELFKAGKYSEAMKQYNHAIEIHAENFEALVARGALYANKESFDLAIQDFESALALNSNHRNARKYLCETLVAKARCCEGQKDEMEAVNLYDQVLTLNPDIQEAKTALVDLRHKLHNRRRHHSARDAEKAPSPPAKESFTTQSRKTLLKLLKEDKDSKKEKSEKKKSKGHHHHHHHHHHRHHSSDVNLTGYSSSEESITVISSDEEGEHHRERGKRSSKVPKSSNGSPPAAHSSHQSSKLSLASKKTHSYQGDSTMPKSVSHLDSSGPRRKSRDSPPIKKQRKDRGGYSSSDSSTASNSSRRKESPGLKKPSSHGEEWQRYNNETTVDQGSNQTNSEQGKPPGGQYQYRPGSAPKKPAAAAAAAPVLTSELGPRGGGAKQLCTTDLMRGKEGKSSTHRPSSSLSEADKLLINLILKSDKK